MTGDARIGVLGRGTVGSAFAKLLADSGAEIEAAAGRRAEIVGVLSRSEGDFERILADSEIIVELIGGIDPAHMTGNFCAGRQINSTASLQRLKRANFEFFPLFGFAGIQSVVEPNQ